MKDTMKQYTEQEMRAEVAKRILDGEEFGRDNQGQLVFYTDLWINKNSGVIQDSADPEYDSCHLDL